MEKRGIKLVLDHHYYFHVSQVRQHEIRQRKPCGVRPGRFANGESPQPRVRIRLCKEPPVSLLIWDRAMLAAPRRSDMTPSPSGVSEKSKVMASN